MKKTPITDPRALSKTVKKTRRNGEPCITDGCVNYAGHLSGLCEACRTLKCSHCGRAYYWIKPEAQHKPKCATCRRLKVD